MRTILVFTLLTAACTGSIPDGPGDDGPGSDAGPGSDDPAACVAAKSYTNLGGMALESDRKVLAKGADRMRIKPFAVLAAEYKSALGLATFDTSAFAATFGKAPARWFAEPNASANTLYGAFSLAYAACTQQTTGNAAYAAAPTDAGADTLCRDYARRAWHREATDDEVNACVAYAVNQTTATDPPAKRWAYTCAAVLSTTGFLTF